MTEIILGGSKSISNRLLIIQALYPNKIQLENLSNSDDTHVLQKALQELPKVIDIHHAGTAMRFLTAYLSILEGQEHILTGSARMHERPVGILVNALRDLGANIKYRNNENFPPLNIKGRSLQGGKISMKGDVSSQYLTALLLIGSALPNGVQINIEGEIASQPYLEMTIAMQNSLSIPAQLKEGFATVKFQEDIQEQSYFIESDWSSASYFYSFMAIGNFSPLKLSSLKKDSLQADSQVAIIYQKYFGVQTEFNENSIILQKIQNFEYPEFIEIDCWNFPDIAQTILISAVGLKIPIKLTGLQTLTIKETDRIHAMKKELNKLGIEVKTTNGSIEIEKFPSSDNRKSYKIKTYNDHRMAMSFAPLQLLYNLEFDEPSVVSKSYPNFWQDVENLYFNL